MLWLDRSRCNTLKIKGVGERLKGGRAIRVQRVHAWSEHLPVDLPVYGAQTFVKGQEIGGDSDPQERLSGGVSVYVHDLRRNLPRPRAFIDPLLITETGF